ncbi:ubiquitin carboxyl-terminal hydrolase isoform B [Micractinium conductrix]|uniref:Ubiquitin carboxyl-terminal hydrolase isoform B n=1 Tax=Micractinium conductrix TaxID=554055 RepID=A0A2P6V7L5_9CHLO|nr:ubiquitin carboxyl-terminal hydrolase isoform B [Micractinium conductrix]|eukprot:PSC70068.1 ubiquitin carboxyl-terminal hydrolase isoform B [Micractinium conductrix]
MVPGAAQQGAPAGGPLNFGLMPPPHMPPAPAAPALRPPSPPPPHPSLDLSAPAIVLGALDPALPHAFYLSDPSLSVEEAAFLLRLLYAPRDASPATLAALGERLPAVAALAHKLDVPALLSALKGYLTGLCYASSSDVPQLLHGLRTAQSALFEGMEEEILDALAARLVPALQALDSSILAQIVFRLAQQGLAMSVVTSAHMPAISDVCPAGMGQVGGFTFSTYNFRPEERPLHSPWVEVGKLCWRAIVFPRGNSEGAADRYLSVFLELGSSGATRTCVACAAATVKVTLLGEDPAGEGGHAQQTPPGEPVIFNRQQPARGWRQFIPLASLHSPEGGLLPRNRLRLRFDIAVHSMQRAEDAAAA